MIDDFLSSRIVGYSANNVDESTERYIRKYWIERVSLCTDWANILKTSFVRFSEAISVASHCSVESKVGGIIFTEEEFSDFVLQVEAVGADRFAVIEDIGQKDWRQLTVYDFFRFAYPPDISWGEMTRSCALADDVFGRPIRCFFVTTDNGRFGKYVNNDAETPYELVFHAKK